MMRPWHSFLWRSGTGTVVPVLCIEGSLLGIRLVPVVPSGLQNMVTQFALYEDSPGKRSPRPSEIDFRGGCIVIQAAVSEYIAIFLSLRCGCCCDITVFLAKNIAILKPRSGEAEDEIRSAFNMAAAEILALSGAESIDGILIGDEAAVYERHPVTVHRDGASLCHFLGTPCRILESQVLGQVW